MLLLLMVIGISIAAVAVLVACSPSTHLFDLLERTFAHEIPEQPR